MTLFAMIRPAAKRTLTDVLKALPKNGEGCLVARDTWHPESGKFWEIVRVEPKKADPSKFQAWGHLYWQGKKVNEQPKRIASVWKYGWFWRLREEERQRMAAEIEAFEKSAAASSTAESPAADAAPAAGSGAAAAAGGKPSPAAAGKAAAAAGKDAGKKKGKS